MLKVGGALLDVRVEFIRHLTIHARAVKNRGSKRTKRAQNLHNCFIPNLIRSVLKMAKSCQGPMRVVYRRFRAKMYALWLWYSTSGA